MDSLARMWISLLHLMWRSAVYFPTTLSSNWLTILLPFVIYIAIQTRRVRKEGWRSMSQHPIDGSTKLLIAAYCILFFWAIVRTVYQDHVQLSKENILLRERLAFRETHGLSLKITGVVFDIKQPQDIMTAMVTLRAFNDGEPTMAHGWNMHIRFADETIALNYITTSPSVERLDKRLEQPLQMSGETTGAVSFVLNRKYAQKKETIYDRMAKDSSAMILVSALDDNNRTISTERNMADMAAEQAWRSRPKEEKTK
jgi:hypothetical protein